MRLWGFNNTATTQKRHNTVAICNLLHVFQVPGFEAWQMSALEVSEDAVHPWCELQKRLPHVWFLSSNGIKTTMIFHKHGVRCRA